MTVDRRIVRSSRPEDARLPSRACIWSDVIRSRSRRLMQVHAERSQRLAMPLFHKKAKVRIPLCGTRVAEGSIRSAWIRYRSAIVST
jgi:hypothetical protein